MTDRPRILSTLSGISGILVTPFDADDAIDPGRLAPVIDRALDAGVHILVANGNTSEYYGLTMAEAEAMVDAAAELVAGRAPLVGGVGRSVGDACRLAKRSVAAGAEAVMVHQLPDPFMAPRGLVDYVRRIADAADGTPLILYVRNDAVGTKCIADLCAVPSVAAVKWATPNPLKLADAMAAARDDIVWVGGLAEVWAPPFYAVGARGFTSGLINVWPARSVAIHAALEAGRYGEAKRLIAGMADFEAVRAEEMAGANVSGVKAALAMQGMDCGHARPPAAWPLTDDQSARLKRLLDGMGGTRAP